MRTTLVVLALVVVLAGGFLIARLRAPIPPIVLPVAVSTPAAVVLPIPVGTVALDFSQLVPPPQGADTAAVRHETVATASPASADDPYRTVLDRTREPDRRNGDMDRLRAGGQPRAIEILLGIATDPAEDEVMRSWAAQHLGMAWPLMDEDQRIRVRTTLQAMIATPTTTDLPAREALFALAQSDRAADRAIAIAAVDAGLGADDDSRLDLHVRLAGELGLARHRPRAEALTRHPSPAVAGAARETVGRLTEHAGMP